MTTKFCRACNGEMKEISKACNLDQYGELWVHVDKNLRKTCDGDKDENIRRRS